MAKPELKVGDWVVITHVEKELCIMGQIVDLGWYRNRVEDPAIKLANYVTKHDPLSFDETVPGWWPLGTRHLRIERLEATDGE